MESLPQYLLQIDPLFWVVPVALVLGSVLVARLSGVPYTGTVVGVLTLAGLGAVSAVGYFDYVQFAETQRLEERRAFDRRAEMLFAKTGEADSVLACLDGTSQGAAREACERTLFADPVRTATAVAIVTKRVVFLDDAVSFVTKRDPEYATRLSALRNAMEADPYGFVAFVFSVEHRCTPAACPRFSLLRDPQRVRENMQVRRLEANLAKHAALAKAAEALATPSSPPLATAIGPPATDPVNPAMPMIIPPSGVPIASDPPAAAAAPVISPPSSSGFAAPPRPAAAKSVDAPARPKSRPKQIDPVSRPSAEPVAGLPRVVPSEYIREAEEKEAAAQSAGRPAGAPVPISPPQQNLPGR